MCGFDTFPGNSGFRKAVNLLEKIIGHLPSSISIRKEGGPVQYLRYLLSFSSAGIIRNFLCPVLVPSSWSYSYWKKIRIIDQMEIWVQDIHGYYILFLSTLRAVLQIVLLLQFHLSCRQVQCPQLSHQSKLYPGQCCRYKPYLFSCLMPHAF